MSPQAHTEDLMIRQAILALTAGTAISVAAPVAGQYAPQAPAVAQTSTAQPASPMIPSATLSKLQSNASTTEQGGDRSSNSAASKQKICEATVIRAGPNQGQIINRCRRSDR